MHQYRKKPIVIQAYQLHAVDCDDCPQWLKDFFDNPELCEVLETCIVINTLEGKMKAYPGDYIIKGIAGEFYPCREDIFNLTYEKVEEQQCNQKS